MLIAVIEDDPGLAAFLEEGLGSEGWAVTTARDGAAGLNLALRREVSLVILDIGLPRLSGEEVLSRLRSTRPEVPVIVLTARDAVEDRVHLLNLGADDYLVKPFSLSELIARVRARVRGSGVSSRVLSVGRVSLDLVARRVTLDGSELELTSREFALLEMFMRHRGQVLSQSQLISQVWGLDSLTSSNVVEVYVSYLRKKIGSSTISTVRGAGYRFEER